MTMNVDAAVTAAKSDSERDSVFQRQRSDTDAKQKMCGPTLPVYIQHAVIMQALV
jgi:hypothetical protein